MRNPTNQEIANGILNYDIKIYRYLDKIYKPRTIRHIKSKAGTKEEGEELYNDILLKLYHIIKHNKYDPSGGSSFLTYFMAVTDNAWIDQLRKKKRKSTIQTTELSDILKNTLKNSEILDDNANLHWVKFLHKYLNQLKPEDFRILWLFYLKKFSVKKIASMQNKSQNFIKLRLFRVRQKLKKWLTDDPDFNFDIAYLEKNNK